MVDIDREEGRERGSKGRGMEQVDGGRRERGERGGKERRKEGGREGERADMVYIDVDSHPKVKMPVGSLSEAVICCIN